MCYAISILSPFHTIPIYLFLKMHTILLFISIYTPAEDLSSAVNVETVDSYSVNVAGSISVAGPSLSIVEGCKEVTPEATTTERNLTASDVSVPQPGPSKRNHHNVLGRFASEWLQALDRDNTNVLALFLSHQVVDMFSFTQIHAAEYAAAMVQKSDRTVRRWRYSILENDGVLPESQQGRYQRCVVLWQNEELKKKATKYV